MTDAAVGVPARLGPGAFRIAALVWWAYLWAVFVYHQRVAGIQLGIAASVALFLIGTAVLALAPVGRVLSPTRMLEAGLTALSLLAAVLVTDLAITIRDNARRAAALAPLAESVRLGDLHALNGEIFPRNGC